MPSATVQCCMTGRGTTTVLLMVCMFFTQAAQAAIYANGDFRCSKGCHSPPPAVPHARWLALQQCTAPRIGNTCIGICNTTAGFAGTTVTARCTPHGWAAPVGSCKAVRCPGLPSAAGIGARPWPKACAGAGINATCTVACRTAAGYAGNATAMCTVDAAGEPHWSKPVNLCVKSLQKACYGTPADDMGRWVRWDDTCNGTASGSKCRARCQASFEGGGYTSTCANGAWLPAVPCGGVAECDFAFVDGCSNHFPWCNRAPPYAVPGAAWDGCDQEFWPAFTDCNATCVAPYTGEGYSAECSGLGGWSPLRGSGCAAP